MSFARLSWMSCLLAAITVGQALADCGDGISDPGEECDDGNIQACDGCSPQCTVEALFSVPFADDFSRGTSPDVGNCWIEDNPDRADLTNGYVYLHGTNLAPDRGVLSSPIFAINTSSTYTLEYDLKIQPDILDMDTYYVTMVYPSSGVVHVETYVDDGWARATDNYLWNSTQWNDTGVEAIRGRWTHVRFEYDFSSLRFSGWVDDQLVWNNADFRNTTLTGSIRLAFMTGETFGSTQMWLDNIQFYEGTFPGPYCGNGIIQLGEQCDDGNTQDGDGCSSACLLDSQVPTVSEWGLLTMMLLTLTVGTVVLTKRRTCSVE